MELQGKNLLVQVVLRSALVENAHIVHFGMQSNRLTGTIPYVPLVRENSATKRLGVDGFPQVITPLVTDIPKGSKSFGSRFGN